MPLKACEVCGTRTKMRCKACKVFTVCSRECLIHAWCDHKRDCAHIQHCKAVVGSAVPVYLEGEEMAVLTRLTDRMAAVCDRHGVNEPPGAESPLPLSEKLDLFVDVLDAFDSSSEANNQETMSVKLLLNRVYNREYRHAVAALSWSQVGVLDCLLRIRGIGAANKAEREGLLYPAATAAALRRAPASQTGVQRGNMQTKSSETHCQSTGKQVTDRSTRDHVEL